MKPKFKVWICLEEHNPSDRLNEYQDLDLPFGATGVFDNEKDAVEFASMLHGIGQHERICDD